MVTINLTSVDKAIETLGSFNGIKGIAGGDIAKLDLDAVRKPKLSTRILKRLRFLVHFKN
ncbi:MAG: hypothetical protein IKC01_07750 [Clostridia bacterium]|nr:hypothetical protein [Clostridia bacterium]